MDSKKKIEKSEASWRNELSEESYRVLREKGTEAPFSGEYNLHFENGVYKCKGCGNPLFKSSSKFDSGCGWPSFDNQIDRESITMHLDKTHGMIRTEICCGKCGGHLGHLFNDGPTESGQRYCVNSVSLDFNSEEPNL